jgi:hypothetical protein
LYDKRTLDNQFNHPAGTPLAERAITGLAGNESPALSQVVAHHGKQDHETDNDLLDI